MPDYQFALKALPPKTRRIICQILQKNMPWTLSNDFTKIINNFSFDVFFLAGKHFLQNISKCLAFKKSIIILKIFCSAPL